MEKQKEYEKYMKQVTDGFIEMQGEITCNVGHKSDNSTGFKIVIWDGGLDYKIELDGGLYIKGITMDEARKYNGKIALKYLKENSLRYDEWFERYN
jgi:hypothetical protein